MFIKEATHLNNAAAIKYMILAAIELGISYEKLAKELILENMPKYVADFFQTADSELKDVDDKAMFMRLVAACAGVFLFNNYDPQGHEELAKLFKAEMLDSIRIARESEPIIARRKEPEYGGRSVH